MPKPRSKSAAADGPRTDWAAVDREITRLDLSPRDSAHARDWTRWYGAKHSCSVPELIEELRAHLTERT